MDLSIKRFLFYMINDSETSLIKKKGKKICTEQLNENFHNKYFENNQIAFPFVPYN